MRHGFYASTSSTINALQVMSYGLELELERTVVNALTRGIASQKSATNDRIFARRAPPAHALLN